MLAIKTEQLTYTYSQGTPFEKVAVEDVSISIEEGEYVGVIGHTGSGKSTLIQHLNGLLAPTSGKVYIGEEDLPFLRDPCLNGTLLFGESPLSLSWERTIFPQDGEEVWIGETLVRFLKVPYHTPGSLAFYLPKEGVLFSGDALFRDGAGRSDLPGGEPRKEEESLRKMLTLPGSVLVYPGHGRRTSVLRERESFPWLEGGDR